MHTGDVVHLFEGKRGKRSVKLDALQSSLSRAWKRVTSFAIAVAEVAREARALEARLLNQRGYRRFVDR
jgi:hypothetical protein